MKDKIVYFIGVLIILLVNVWFGFGNDAATNGIIVISTLIILDKLNEY